MDIYTITETKFTKGVHSLIISLCINNPGHHNVYVAYSYIEEDRIKWLKKLEKKYDVSIHFVHLNGDKLFTNEIFKTSPRYCWEAMARLLPQLIVPEDCHKVLYIDADIVVNGSLEDFYNIDLTNKSIAAVAARRDGSGNQYYDMNAGVYDLIKIDLGDDVYFNAGVFLANVDYFRENITENTYLKVSKKYREKLVFADQCLMNLIFRDNSIKLIDFRYNCCFACYTPISCEEYKWLKKNIVCLHYIAGPKPWSCSKYYNKIVHIYLKYIYQDKWINGFCKNSIYLLFKPYRLLSRGFSRFIDKCYNKV